MELYVAVFVGALMHLLFSLNTALPKQDFKWSTFFSHNVPVAMLNILCGFVLVWRREDVSQILPITGLSAVFLGYTGQSIFKNIFKTFNSKFETYVGK